MRADFSCSLGSSNTIGIANLDYRERLRRATKGVGERERYVVVTIGDKSNLSTTCFTEVTGNGEAGSAKIALVTIGDKSNLSTTCFTVTSDFGDLCLFGFPRR